MLEWLAGHWEVAALAAAYTMLLARHAMVGRRRTHSVADYYVGGRSMGGIALGLSFFATYSSTNSFVGFAGKAYEWGAPWLLLTPGILVFLVLSWTLVAPRLRELTGALGSVTLPDLIGFRYDSTKARVVAALVVIFASLLYMTAVFRGIGLLLEVFLEIPYPLAIGIVLIIVMGYTAVGGFVSVVETDVSQGVLMLFAAVALFAGTVTAAGGLGAVETIRAQPGGAALFGWNAAMPFPLLVGIIAAQTIKFVVEPRQLSRFYALKDARAARQGLWVSLAAFAFAYSLLMPVGLYARRLFPDGTMDTDRIVPELLSGGAFFPPAIGAVLLLAMIAAAMSSLDSVLLVVASTFQRDVRSVWRAVDSDQQALRETRICVAAFAVLTAAVALDPPGEIVLLTAFSGSLYAACFVPSVVLGLHWRRGDGASVLASFGLGLATLLLWSRAPWSAQVHPVFPAMGLSMLGYAAVAKVRSPVESDVLDRLIGPASTLIRD